MPSKPEGHGRARSARPKCEFYPSYAVESFPVAISEGSHPFPSRTRKLSPPEPMVLRGKPRGRVGRCRILCPRSSSEGWGLFLCAGGAVPVWNSRSHPRPGREARECEERSKAAPGPRVRATFKRTRSLGREQGWAPRRPSHRRSVRGSESQRSIASRAISSVSEPFSNSRSWKTRRSNAAPSSFSARWRSANNSSAPVS